MEPNRRRRQGEGTKTRVASHPQTHRLPANGLRNPTRKAQDARCEGAPAQGKATPSQKKADIHSDCPEQAPLHQPYASKEGQCHANERKPSKVLANGSEEPTTDQNKKVSKSQHLTRSRRRTVLASCLVQSQGKVDHHMLMLRLGDGDAKAGDRYTPLAGQLVFAPGESSKTVTVLIPNNGKYVGTRQFGLVAQLEGESTDANLVPDAWQAAIATPSEQVRKWKLVPGEDGNGSVTINVTSTKSADHIITLDLDLDGTVIPQAWNRNTNSCQNIPFNSTNGIIEVQDINGDMISDLYRIRFQDGGVFDGDGLNNGLVALNFEFAQLKDVAVPLGGGRIEGAEDNNYINAQNSTGTNRLEGQGGMDVLIGSPQRDVLLGGDGNDIIMGGGNIDQLYGGAGDDLLDGGLGINFLYGGVGSDSFVLRQGDGPHRVMDFNSAEGDFFLLENLSLSQLGFSSNQITLGNNTLATVVDALGKPVTNFAANPSWFSTVLN